MQMVPMKLLRVVMEPKDEKIVLDVDFCLWKEERVRLLTISPRASSTPSYSPGPSTPPSYSPGSSTPQIYSPRSSRNAECSNCKHLLDKITVLDLEMYMHPEQHTVNSVALLHEVYNDKGKLDLESDTLLPSQPQTYHTVIMKMVPYEAFACGCGADNVVLRESIGKIALDVDFCLWKEERVHLLTISPGASSTPSYSPGPSTPLSYSPGSSTPQIYSPGSSRNAECSNCKHLLEKITKCICIQNNTQLIQLHYFMKFTMFTRLFVNNDDAAVAQRRFEDKQLEEKTNTDYLVKEQKKVHLGIKVGANIMVTGVPGQEGAEGNVAEKKNVNEFMKANLGKLLKYKAWLTRQSPVRGSSIG
ncbi:hypothetical protein Tco_0541269 [Tanacetum coccineum]